MRTAISERVQNLTLSEINGLALCYGVPVEDVLLIALNLLGIASENQRHRAVMMISLVSQPDVRWLVPLNSRASPVWLRSEKLSLGTDVVGWLRRIDADEVGGGRLRDGGRTATCDPNARSRCTGGTCCPNLLEAAPEARQREHRELGELLAVMLEQHPSRDRTGLREVTVSTGCFERKDISVADLVGLRSRFRNATGRPGSDFFIGLRATDADRLEFCL